MSPVPAKSASRSESAESEIPPIARELPEPRRTAAEDAEDDGVPALAEEHERTGQGGVTPDAVLGDSGGAGLGLRGQALARVRELLALVAFAVVAS